jgi:hypothetical protein
MLELLLASVIATTPLAPGDGASADAAEFLQANCLDCHGDGTVKGSLDLRPVVASMREGTLTVVQRAVLRRARARVDAGEMPPLDPDSPPLDRDSREKAVAQLRAACRTIGPLPVPPGPPPRRMNRAEYAWTVQDAFGIDVSTLGALPPDDVGAGFDNVASVLSLPPSAMERYVDLAERIAEVACPDSAAAGAVVLDVPGDKLRVPKESGNAGKGVAVVWSNGSAHASFDAPAAGAYEVTFRASGTQAGPEPVKVAVELDREAVAWFDVPEREDAPGSRRVELNAARGKHRIAVAFLNDYFTKNGPGGKPADRNLLVHSLRVRGPLGTGEPPAWQRRMARDLALADDASPRAREDAELGWLVARLLRRPSAATDLATLRAAIDPVAAGAPRDARLRAALTALLAHPEFLFHVEAEPNASAPARDLTPHELASRLAAFLWCSAPDAELAAAAAEGSLLEPAGLRRAVDRMLDDPRASRLADRFAPQWLAIDALEDRTPDPRQFPGIDAELLGSMRAESVLFFDAVLRERRPAAALVDADFTFIDERLARHYGMPAPTGGGMRRVAADPLRGGGVLAHASVLVATSNPSRTSPVKRGKWVLDALLDAAPPPPPPGTPQLPEQAPGDAARSVRELLAAHRADPNCAACHLRMDAIGFAFERWDPVGRPRSRVGGADIDDLGELPDGRTLQGVPSLRAELRTSPDFLRSLAKHLHVYATGRECTPADDDLLDRMLEELGPSPSLRDMVIAIATSPAMRQRGAR